MADEPKQLREWLLTCNDTAEQVSAEELSDEEVELLCAVFWGNETQQPTLL